MGEITTTVAAEIKAAEAGLDAAIQARKEAELVAEAAQARQLLAEKASPEAVGVGGYSNAAQWRQAHDEVAFAFHVSQKSGEALAAAQTLEAECRAKLKAAEIRNQVMTARAVAEKLGRLGEQVIAEFEKLARAQGDALLLGGRRGQSVGFSLEAWTGMLAFRAKLANIPTNLKKDGRGRGFEAFPGLAEAMLMESLTAASHGTHPALAVLRRMRAAEGVAAAVEAPAQSLMEVAEALDQLPDPVADGSAEAVEPSAKLRLIPPAVINKTNYSNIGPEEPA
jgi:hypothetical protein